MDAFCSRSSSCVLPGGRRACRAPLVTHCFKLADTLLGTFCPKTKVTTPENISQHVRLPPEMALCFEWIPFACRSQNTVEKTKGHGTFSLFPDRQRVSSEEGRHQHFTCRFRDSEPGLYKRTFALRPWCLEPEKLALQPQILSTEFSNHPSPGSRDTLVPATPDRSDPRTAL